MPLVARFVEILTFNLDVCTAPPCVQKGDTVYFISVVESLKNRSRESMVVTPCLNEKINSGNLQDLAQWWRTSQAVDIPKISHFYLGLFEKTHFLCFYIIKSSKKRAKIPLILTSEGQKNLTGLAGGVRKGQNRSKYCSEWASPLALEPSRGPLNGSRTPEMDPK